MTANIAAATPRQLAAYAEHKARMARIAARAVGKSPAPAPSPIPTSTPAPVCDEQDRPAAAPTTHPWFHIVELMPGRITIDKIQAIVCRDFGLSSGEFLAKRRTKSVVRPRQIAMYLAKELTQRSLLEIGRRFGGRDHTTILHAVRTITRLMATDADLAKRVDMLRRELEGHA